MFSVLYQAFFNKNKSNRKDSKNKLKICINCGRKIYIEHKFCTHCGREQVIVSDKEPTEES